MFDSRGVVCAVLVFGFALGAPLSVAPAAAEQADLQEGLSFLDTGPLRIRDQFLLSSGFMTFDPVSADVLAPGQWQIDIVGSVTNAFAHSGSVEDFLEERQGRGPLTLSELRQIEQDDGSGVVFVDGELYRTAFAFRRGISKGLQVELVVPLLNFGGGFLDPTVESFHDVFSLGQAGRLGVPRNDYTVYVRGSDGELFRSREPGHGIGDITLGVKAALPVPGDAWRMAIEGKVELPTGDEEDLYGSGSLDLGTQLLATRYFKRSCIHLGVAAVHLGAADVFHLDGQLRLSAMAGYERAVGSGMSVLIQATVSQSPFEDLDIEALDPLAFLVDIGFKKGFGERRVFFFALSENLVNFDNTPDVGLHMGLTQTF